MENREIAKAGVSPENLELLKIALKTAELAEENILKFYQNDVGVEWKADKTPVTIADKGTEELARKFYSGQRKLPALASLAKNSALKARMRNTSG